MPLSMVEAETAAMLKILRRSGMLRRVVAAMIKLTTPHPSGPMMGMAASVTTLSAVK